MASNDSQTRSSDKGGDSRSPRRARRAPLPVIFWVGLVAVPVALAILAFQSVSGGGPRAAAAVGPLPAFGLVPDFSLVEAGGRKVTRDDLMGKVWLADFVFTRCHGPCPELSMRMRSVQQSLRDKGSGVKLISFSLDPTYDTPAVLRAYARKNHADPDRWWFLTGDDESQMHRLVREGLKQAVGRSVGNGEIVHSTYFMLVDRSGRIRAAYEGLNPKSKAKILRDIDRLLGEPSGS